MITNYHTLRALVAEWAPALTGCIVGDAYSQVRDELSLALAAPEQAWTLRVSTRPPLQYIFRSPGTGKARRNVATLFEDAFDRTVTGVRLATRDRIVYLDLDGDLAFQILLFGPSANVLLVDGEGTIREAFRSDADLAGTAAPAPRPAPDVETLEAFEARWNPKRKTTAHAVASALPLFDRTLGREVMTRAGVAEEQPAACTAADREALFRAAQDVRQALAAPEPCIYWREHPAGGDFRLADAFSLLPLRHREGQEVEPFETVDRAVAVFVRRSLAQRRFAELYEPLAKALSDAAAHYRTAAERMLEELSNESRADRYERWGHLLMATPNGVPMGADEVELPDLFGGGEPVVIPLQPRLSPVENAERFYAKARRTRSARAHAEERLMDYEAAAGEAETLLAELRSVDALKALERFRKAEAERLARFAGDEAEEADRVPFRRYTLPEGYEVWVGRNARQNDELTFRYAQKYDRWMHARGVPGSHAVLRLPNRQATPGRHVLERAAAIAAYHSKARTAGLAPVMVTERKYVRKPKGAAPGAVVVEREDVLLVEPRLPNAE